MIVNERIKAALARNNIQSSVEQNKTKQWWHFLLNIGNVSINDKKTQMVLLPQNIISKCTSLSDFCANFYKSKPRIVEEILDYYEKRSILTPKNRVVTEINQICISEIPGEMHQYISYDANCVDNNESHWPIEDLNNIEVPGLPPHILFFKKNCPVILMRNLNSSQ